MVERFMFFSAVASPRRRRRRTTRAILPPSHDAAGFVAIEAGWFARLQA
jgi:hypothetical protein